jgi:hypothetical protein
MKLKFITRTLVFLAVGLGLSGCLNKGGAPENLKVPRLYLEGRSMNYGSMTPQMFIMPQSGTQVEVMKEPFISEFEIVNVELVEVDLGMALLLQLTDRGARVLYRACVTNAGSQVLMTVNGMPLGLRRLDGTITDGNFYTFVEADDAILNELTLDLKESIMYLQTKAERPW